MVICIKRFYLRLLNFKIDRMIFDCGIEVGDNIKGLLFDLDGTLVDNMHLHIEAWVESGKEYGVHITPEMIQKNAGIPTKQLIAKFNLENDWNVAVEAFTADKQSRYRRIKANAGPIKKIQPIIDIAAHFLGQIPMTIGTGSSRRNALSALEDAGIIQWFDLIVTADDVQNPKPHPEIYLKGADHIKVAPEHCLVFEDGDKGIESAIAAGMHWVDVRKHL